MIKKLQKNFIRIAALALLSVILIVVASINGVFLYQCNQLLDNKLENMLIRHTGKQDDARDKPQKEKAPQRETASQATQPLELVKEPTEDIPSETVHAKTGYVEPEPTPEPKPTPEPTAPADRQAAIDVANAYAVTQYGVVTDSGLTLDNSAYRFPAAVPVDASQETLEAKALDMVDFTFRQLMMQAGRDSVADAGFHCNVCIVEDGGSLLIYVLYD